MHRKIVFVILMLASLAANAGDFNVGGVTVTIATPNGFAQLTPNAQPLYDLSLDIKGPDNVRIVTFVEEEIMPAALRGETPTFERYINVEIMKALESYSASQEEFDQLKGIVENDLENTIAQIEKTLPGEMADISDRASETLDVELAISVNDIVPFPVHTESLKHTSHSSIMRYAMSGEAADIEAVVTATTTFLYVKGRVIYIYVYGGPDDLEWTREQSTRLIRGIVARN